MPFRNNVEAVMTNKQSQYCWSDAWLLLATIYAERTDRQNLRNIIAAGDYINHAIFTFEELSGGLARLSAGGFINEQSGVFTATDLTIESYSRTTTPRRTALKEVADMMQLLKNHELTERNSRRGPVRLTKKTYNEAVKEYVDK